MSIKTTEDDNKKIQFMENSLSTPQGNLVNIIGPFIMYT